MYRENQLVPDTEDNKEEYSRLSQLRNKQAMPGQILIALQLLDTDWQSLRQLIALEPAGRWYRDI